MNPYDNSSLNAFRNLRFLEDSPSMKAMKALRSTGARDALRNIERAHSLTSNFDNAFDALKPLMTTPKLNDYVRTALGPSKLSEVMGEHQKVLQANNVLGNSDAVRKIVEAARPFETSESIKQALDVLKGPQMKDLFQTQRMLFNSGSAATWTFVPPVTVPDDDLSEEAAVRWFARLPDLELVQLIIGAVVMLQVLIMQLEQSAAVEVDDGVQTTVATLTGVLEFLLAVKAYKEKKRAERGDEAA